MPRNRLKDDGKQRGGRPSPPRERPADLPPITTDWLSATGQAQPQVTRPLEVLEELAEPGAGRYSVNRDANGQAYHKWRYTGGRWDGHYVMYVGDKYHTIGQGILGLESKLALVAAGLLKPTLDKYK